MILQMVIRLLCWFLDGIINVASRAEDWLLRFEDVEPEDAEPEPAGSGSAYLEQAADPGIEPLQAGVRRVFNALKLEREIRVATLLGLQSDLLASRNESGSRPNTSDGRPFVTWRP